MLERTRDFINALRGRGVRVSIAEELEAAQAVGVMGVERNLFKSALRSTLVKDADKLQVFDETFEVFFRDGGKPVSIFGDNLAPEDLEQMLQEIEGMNNKLRQLMRQLAEGKPLNRSQMELAEMFANDKGYGMYSYEAAREFADAMKRYLAFPRIRGTLEELAALMREMNLSKQVIQGVMSGMERNLAQWGYQIDSAAFSNLKHEWEGSGEHNQEDVGDLPFWRLNQGDKGLVRKEVRRISQALKTKVALRSKHSTQGKLDVRTIVRRNMRYVGVPIDLHYTSKKLKPNLVVLLDLSTSMLTVSGVMLQFLYSLQDLVGNVHAFGYIDHLEYITPELRSRNEDDAIQTVRDRMPPGNYTTNLGFSLQNFEADYLALLDRRATLMILGDARNNKRDPALGTFDRLAKRAQHTIWINPETRVLWGEGDSDMLKYMKLVTMAISVETLNDLGKAVTKILTL